MTAKTKKQKIALLTKISGVSDSHARQAVQILEIESIEAFIAAGQKGELQAISGVGAKREATMLKAALIYQSENTEKTESKNQKKKENLNQKKRPADSMTSSEDSPSPTPLEKVTLPKLAIRLLRKVIRKAIKNR